MGVVAKLIEGLEKGLLTDKRFLQEKELNTINFIFLDFEESERRKYQKYCF